MPVYMYQASYSGEAIKALVNNPQDRTGAARAAIEASGGTMVGVALPISSTGAIVGGKTTKLLTLDQAVSGMKKAKAVLSVYKPPA